MPKQVNYRPEVINHLEHFLKTCSHPRAHFMHDGERGYSMYDFVREIKARTRVGISFYEVWESLYDKTHKTKKKR